MTHTRSTNAIRLFAGLLTSMLFASLAVPLGAQPATQTHPFYDIAHEVTLKGTVIDVIAQSPRGTIPGSHIVVETQSGAIDASVGKWGLQGKSAPVIAKGEEIEVTGVMKMLKEKQVFVTRTVKVGSQVYEMRNKNGVPFSPLSRERTGQKPAQKGETL
jgi:DNA/RNA endonuclease YhcR with UshA esterase domain